MKLLDPGRNNWAVSLARRAAVASLGVAAAGLVGCTTVGALIGGMAQSYKDTSNNDVDAKYEGLRDKSFAVVVAADRVIQADYPSVVGDLTITISRRLADLDVKNKDEKKSKEETVGAAGYVPGESVLEFQSIHPNWVTMTSEELAKELGVQRLVLIDLQEFRLNDPGNPYLWAGVASGTVRVVEADGPVPSIYAFQEPVRVAFPDGDGIGPMQMPAQLVQLELSKRVVDRCSWMFYKHEEPSRIKY